MSLFTAIWPVLSSYRPGAARQRRAERFGAFVPTHVPPVYRRPKNDIEAQKLYNHIRTMAFYLDAAPLLSDLGLPFRAGLDDIISLIPLYGDIISGIIQLYAVFLCWLFGVPVDVVIKMVFNVLIDVVVGIVPLVGDILDNLFKSNLRNLALLEVWLLSPPPSMASNYHILLMPDSNTYLPEPKVQSRWSAWFGSNHQTEAADDRERERVSGKIFRTRRMLKDEGQYAFGGETQPTL